MSKVIDPAEVSQVVVEKKSCLRQTKILTLKNIRVQFRNKGKQSDRRGWAPLPLIHMALSHHSPSIVCLFCLPTPLNTPATRCNRRPTFCGCLVYYFASYHGHRRQGEQQKQ